MDASTQIYPNVDEGGKGALLISVILFSPVVVFSFFFLCSVSNRTEGESSAVLVSNEIHPL